MAKAFKCDRCGELYEEREFPNSGLYVGKMDSFYILKAYDLCSACRAYLEVWWSAAYKGDNTTVKEENKDYTIKLLNATVKEE